MYHSKERHFSYLEMTFCEDGLLYLLDNCFKAKHEALVHVLCPYMCILSDYHNHNAIRNFLFLQALQSFCEGEGRKGIYLKVERDDNEARGD
jgi:hypothetical protein